MWRLPVPARPDLAELDQFQPERLDLCDDTEHRGPILEQSGEHGLSTVDLMDHRGEGRERGGAKLAVNPDAVQVGSGTHATMVVARWVTRQRLNMVITISGKTDEVDARERAVNLLKRAPCAEAAEIDREESGVRQEGGDLTVGIGVIA